MKTLDNSGSETFSITFLSTFFLNKKLALNIRATHFATIAGRLETSN